MTNNGRLQDIHRREVTQRRRSTLYVAGLLAVIVLVLAALAVAARWISLTNA